MIEEFTETPASERVTGHAKFSWASVCVDIIPTEVVDVGFKDETPSLGKADVVERPLPRMTEGYVVVERGFWKGMRGIPDNYR
jgi:hypothetical protein